MTEHEFESGIQDVVPADVTEWLRLHQWRLTGTLGTIAQRWEGDDSGVIVPLARSSSDFRLRWSEMLDGLSGAFDTDPTGVLLAVAKSGSDIAEFRASGEGRIDDSIPLGDASTLIDSVRRAMQASANSALQPRSYYGHRIPDAAREHARGVRMGQTRSGSYIIPVISRIPILAPDDEEDAVLFEEVTYQPLARSAMLQLAEGLATLRDLTHGERAPGGKLVTESVAAGVSSELCDAVANTLETSSVTNLDVSFSWAQRLPRANGLTGVGLEDGAAPLIRGVAEILRGEPVVGRQTFVGYVKRMDRGEEDEIGRIVLRVLDNDKARNITMDLNDEDYHVAGEANVERRMVSATGILHREPGRALRFTEVTDFHLIEGFPGFE